jgi:hypothetical protein
MCMFCRSLFVFSEVRVTQSLVLCVCFVDRCLFFCTFSFGHCVVCSSSFYRFLLPLWYLQTHLDAVQILKGLRHKSIACRFVFSLLVIVESVRLRIHGF